MFIHESSLNATSRQVVLVENGIEGVGNVVRFIVLLLELAFGRKSRTYQEVVEVIEVKADDFFAKLVGPFLGFSAAVPPFQRNVVVISTAFSML